MPGKTAMDFFAIQSTSAIVEQIVFTAGITTSGRRNRMSGRNLEKEVLIQKVPYVNQGDL